MADGVDNQWRDYLDCRQVAEYVSSRYCPVKPRTVRNWPLKYAFKPSKRVVFPRGEVDALAQRMIERSAFTRSA